MSQMYTWNADIMPGFARSKDAVSSFGVSVTFRAVVNCLLKNKTPTVLVCSMYTSLFSGVASPTLRSDTLSMDLKMAELSGCVKS